MDPGDGGNYHPTLDPKSFTDRVDNPYMPLVTGSHWRYQGTATDESETIDVVVTAERRVIMGISTVVVRDTVTSEGEVVEDTFDWYAQDSDGNVWYFGEDTKEYENGKVTSTHGSWEAGVGGAQPGIVMPAQPKLHAVIRQEYLAGEAEDMMEIWATTGDVKVPAGSWSDTVTTHDWTPLEPTVVEEKTYVRGVGNVRTAHIAGGSGMAELIEFTPGS
jgi:hypothetical protein